MQYVEAAGPISCFSFMSFHMLIVLMLKRTSRAKHSILLKGELLSRRDEGSDWMFHIITL